VCGFIGKISFNSINTVSIENNNKVIECRGPDEKTFHSGTFNEFFNNEDILNFAFVFNRLAIVDLGENSSQPMFNKQKNTVLMFNGEIFNHKSLRKEMENDGVKFFSDHSDSEVVLNGLTYYGNSFVEKMNGQFSIVFYNSNENKLVLIRDRFGQKPLFFAKNHSDITFGSNLISVVNEHGYKAINKKSYEDFINYGVVPSPNTIFEDVFKLEPSQIIEIDFNNSQISLRQYKYWNIKNKESEEKFDNEVFDSIISDAIKIREEADVPVANFLSGGIDSTYVIKNMYDRGKKANSFSVVFTEKKYDERKWSQQVSKKYQTNHTEYEMDTTEFEKYVFQSVELFDEPYSDPSTVPSFVISKIISGKYKAAISGDGGDELIGGYKRVNNLYFNKQFTHPMKFINNIYPNHRGTGNTFMKHSRNLIESSASYFSDKNLLSFLDLKDNYTYEKKYFEDLSNPYKTILASEYSFFLSEMMMLKVDRTSMSNSLEVRSPFVDYRLVEYIFGTKPTYLNKENPKKLFKDKLSYDFNSEFLNRPKQGFVFNLEDWVFKNKELIYDNILEVDIFKNFKRTHLDKLFTQKSRINGLRIWRIFLINKYIDLNL
jgi:asparagine synthase (glutamine-hydrolysing)